MEGGQLRRQHERQHGAGRKASGESEQSARCQSRYHSAIIIIRTSSCLRHHHVYDRVVYMDVIAAANADQRKQRPIPRVKGNEVHREKS